MTDRDRIYTAAVMLPPSPERTRIIELCVQIEREKKAAAVGQFHDQLSTCHMLVCEELN